MKTKIKIFLISVLILVILAGATLLVLANTKTSYFIDINKPDNIIVYFNYSTNNIVYEKDSEEYIAIYNAIKDCHKQNTLTSVRKNKLFEKTKILEADNATIDFKNLIINFAYNSPQALKLNGKTYEYNKQGYWYKNLIFTISNTGWQYNSIAIIPTSDSKYYTSPFNYNLYYSVYSNYSLNYESLYNFKR